MLGVERAVSREQESSRGSPAAVERIDHPIIEVLRAPLRSVTGVNAGRTLTPYCRLNLDPPGSVFDGYLVVLGAAGGGPARCARVR